MTNTILTIVTLSSLLAFRAFGASDPFSGIENLVTDTTTSVTQIVVGFGILALVLYAGITLLSTRFDFRIEIFARIFIGVVIASLASKIIEYVISFVG